MALNANKIKYSGSGKRPEPMEPANYPGRLVQVIDLGLQPQRPYEGQEKKPAYEIMCTYELGTEFLMDEDGNPDETKPRWLSETFAVYPMSSDKAKSTKRYMVLDPQMKHGGDWSKLVGSPCLVAVVNSVSKANGITYNNVGAISPPVKGMTVPELANPEKVKVLDLSDPDMDVFNSLPEWLQDKIKSNLEYRGSRLESLMETTSEPEGSYEEGDDIPF